MIKATFLSAMTSLFALGAILAPDLVWASPDQDGPEITALAMRKAGPAWLDVYGPANDGAYSARIDISDLDLTQQTGRTAMISRVRRGVHDLCAVVAYEPDRHEQIYRPDRAASNCFYDTYHGTEPQIMNMLAAIDRGDSVPQLAIATVGVARAR